jgi:hypothetical protein
MGVRLRRSGRPAVPPPKNGSLHVRGKWANRLWIYKESIKYGLRITDIFDELIESRRLKHHRYNPQKVADAVAWDNDNIDDLDIYDKEKQTASAIISKVEQKINELDARRSV